METSLCDESSSAAGPQCVSPLRRPQTPHSKLLEPTSVKQTHQRPGWISFQGAFTSSKPADWSSSSGRFLLSWHRDPCVASSLSSLCISTLTPAFFSYSISTFPSISSLYTVNTTFFFLLPLLDELSLMVSLQQSSNTVDFLISGPLSWEALRALGCLFSPVEIERCQLLWGSKTTELVPACWYQELW